MGYAKERSEARPERWWNSSLGPPQSRPSGFVGRGGARKHT